MWNPWAASDEIEDLRGRLKWFLLGRVAVLSCFFLVVAVGYLVRGEQGYLISINSLIAIVGLTYAVTLLSALLIDRLDELRLFTFTQMAIDVLLITGAIYLTSGVDSPFAFLYTLAIINGAVLMFSNGALFTAIIATLMFDGLLLSLATGVIESVRPLELPPAQLDAELISRLITTNLTFVLVGFLSSFLTKRIFAAEQELAEQQAENQRIAILKDTLAQAIGSTLMTTDSQGIILAVDTQGEGIFSGQPMERFRGKDIGVIFPALKLTPSARLRFLQSPGAIEPIEFSYEPDGAESAIEVRCSTAPLRDTFGHALGALYVFQDVTALRHVEDVDSTDAFASFAPNTAEAPLDTVHPSDGLYGKSPLILALRKLVARVANSDATVLITGESGTGKEVVARAIHEQSPRRDKHFVAINCGAIPENLVESELFGHSKGAFTGADADRTGSFRMADGGTIFLDEIGELPLHLQVKLLRVVQERVFRPVGSETNVAVNVRIITATNRDLQQRIQDGQFREDLFYRINVIHIEVPPLRDRAEDIPLLVRHFLEQFAGMHERKIERFSTDAARALFDYDYPGNVRELENIVEHAVALCDGDTASIRHLPGYLTGGESVIPGAASRAPRPSARTTLGDDTGGVPTTRWEDIDLEHDLAEYEKNILLRALNEAGGVKKKAAALLGINYRSLRHRLQKYGLADIGPGSAAVQ